MTFLILFNRAEGLLKEATAVKQSQFPNDKQTQQRGWAKFIQKMVNERLNPWTRKRIV
jgi:hypothetical protein